VKEERPSNPREEPEQKVKAAKEIQAKLDDYKKMEKERVSLQEGLKVTNELVGEVLTLIQRQNKRMDHLEEVRQVLVEELRNEETEKSQNGLAERRRELFEIHREMEKSAEKLKSDFQEVTMLANAVVRDSADQLMGMVKRVEDRSKEKLTHHNRQVSQIVGDLAEVTENSNEVLERWSGSMEEIQERLDQDKGQRARPRYQRGMMPLLIVVLLVQIAVLGLVWTL